MTKTYLTKLLLLVTILNTILVSYLILKPETQVNWLYCSSDYCISEGQTIEELNLEPNQDDSRLLIEPFSNRG